MFVGLLEGTLAAYDDTTLEELWKINMSRSPAGQAAMPNATVL